MEVLVENLTFLTWQQVLMWLIGGVLIYLAIVKEMEPSLLLPMGFGAILVNLPNSGAAEVIAHLFELGIAGHELFPLLLFIGIGAMIDFQPLLANPKLMIFGAAAQFGIFFTLGLASLLGFELNDAASIAIIGAADGPTSIFVAQQLGSSYTAAIMVAAYSYMALVPMVQPPVIRLCTTQAERKIKMTYKGRPVSKTTKILFPIAVLLQDLLQPCFILPGSAQILSGKEAVLHDGHGEELGLGVNARILGAGGSLLGEGEHGKIPVGFQNGVLHGGDVQHVLFPQVPRQLVQRHPGAAEIVLHQLPVFNQDHRLAAQQLPELHTV